MSDHGEFELEDDDIEEVMPPQAKVISAGARAATMVIASLAEVAAISFAGFLFYHGKIGVEMWAGVTFGPMVGPMIQRARGKTVIPTTLLAMGVAGKMAASGVAMDLARRLLVALIATTALSSCAHSGLRLPETTEMRETKSALDEVADKLDARLELAKNAFSIADSSLMFVCNLGMSDRVCTTARKVAETADGHLKAADDAIDYYRETGTGFDAAMKEIDDAERRCREFRAMVESLRKSLT